MIHKSLQRYLLISEERSHLFDKRKNPKSKRRRGGFLSLLKKGWKILYHEGSKNRNVLLPKGIECPKYFSRGPLLNCIRKTQSICVNQNIFQKGFHSWYRYYYSICMSFLFITPIISTRTKMLKIFYINITRFRETHDRYV